ncbi:MAG TPA: SET domain-containing protein-lysine N-methyltransferase [Candidatus Paceibacterota bacterium]|nr:SET domain-containing protein-lysine N-methyltransferase [Candidatus Paceibacterota bacterium]
MSRIFSWINPKLQVIDKGELGKGVKTGEPIKKGEKVAVFGGYIFTVQEEQELPPGMNDYAHQISDEFVMGIMDESQIQPVDFFNHSCEPNVGFKGQIFLVAMRDIVAGEEICFDYAMVLSAKIPPYPVKCFCGQKTCRGTLSYDDWKLPRLHEKYKGYFQPYLEDKIAALKDKRA